MGNIASYPIESGLEQMERLVSWYLETQENHEIGFFQIGGGIAGDFPVCAVPLIRQDLERMDCSLWSYFCQVSDGTTSYGASPCMLPLQLLGVTATFLGLSRDSLPCKLLYLPVCYTCCSTRPG